MTKVGSANTDTTGNFTSAKASFSFNPSDDIAYRNSGGFKIWAALILLLPLILSGCRIFEWDVDDTAYILDVYLVNRTQDSLEILFGEEIPDIVNIGPGDSSNYFSRIHVGKEEDPIRETFFGDYAKIRDERVRIRINESIVVDWIGPPREMGPGDHHFFNYNSWEIWIGDNDLDGMLRFTISTADFSSN